MAVFNSTLLPSEEVNKFICRSFLTSMKGLKIKGTVGGQSVCACEDTARANGVIPACLSMGQVLGASIDTKNCGCVNSLCKTV